MKSGGILAGVALALVTSVTFGAPLEGHWTFDTDFTDSSGNGRNGAGAGATVPGNITGSSQIGAGALTLDGSGDHVAITGYKGQTGTAARTISAWIRADAGNDDQSIMSWGNNAAGQKWTFRLQDGNGPVDGSLRVEVNGGFQVGTTDLDDGNWHHVAATFMNDGTPNVQDIRLYVDGQLEAISASQSQAINTASTADVRIGQDFVGRPWNGDLDDAGIFSEALRSEEIGAIFGFGSVLDYDLSESNSLLELFDSQDPGARVEIDGLTWAFVPGGLAGDPGMLNGGNGVFSIILDGANGSGLQTVPEPATLAVWTMLGLAAVGFVVFRRRR